jgi:hypothetical protein
VALEIKPTMDNTGARGKTKMTKEKLSPTEQMLLFLEEARQNKLRWEMIKEFLLENKAWQKELEQSGVNLGRVTEKIGEIDLLPPKKR